MIKSIADNCSGDYTFIMLGENTLIPGRDCFSRMAAIGSDTGAVMLYADYRHRNTQGKTTDCQLIDKQEGALRDDFDFGQLIAVKTASLREAVTEMTSEYRAAGFYDLWLRLSRYGEIVHINEYLYTIEENTSATSHHEAQFSYVDPCNRASQIEMEEACTAYLKATGGWLAPAFKEIDLEQEKFDTEATVIIPVKNRCTTIGDALESALSQMTDFPYT